MKESKKATMNFTCRQHRQKQQIQQSMIADSIEDEDDSVACNNGDDNHHPSREVELDDDEIQQKPQPEKHKRTTEVMNWNDNDDQEEDIKSSQEKCNEQQEQEQHKGDNDQDDVYNNDNVNVIDESKMKEAVIYLKTTSTTKTSTTTATTSSDNSSPTNEVDNGEGMKWELTWPIWHLLPRHEKKELAVLYGYKTIGEFEEYMSLQQAYKYNDKRQPYPNELLYKQSYINSNTVIAKEDDKTTFKSSSEYDDENDESSDDGVNNNTNNNNDVIIDDNDIDYAWQYDSNDCDNTTYNTTTIANDTKLTNNELYRVGGKILMIPEDIILYKIFDWLPVCNYCNLALVSPYWKSFTRTEHVYQRLCERIYLHQSKRAQLNVHHFHNSYRQMLYQRPRVLALGGVYVMKYSQIKRIQRDMFTEIPHGAILESVYYRYLYFLEDGRVLYALTSAPPHEVFPRLLRVNLSSSSSSLNDIAHNNYNNTAIVNRTSNHIGRNSNVKANNKNSKKNSNHHQHRSTSNAEFMATIDSSIVWGTYTVQKYKVVVQARQSWQYVQFHLTIRPEYTMYGRFGYLSFDEHISSCGGNFTDGDLVTYKVPDEPFRFVPDRRL